MKEEQIRGFNHQIIGLVEHYPNGDKTVREWPSRRILGRYKANEDLTRDFFGRIIGRGDMVVSLLYKDNK